MCAARRSTELSRSTTKSASIKSRSARKNAEWYVLYCFAERRHALSFGGEMLSQQKRRRTHRPHARRRFNKQSVG
jgi:hypothetical protein